MAGVCSGTLRSITLEPSWTRPQAGPACASSSSSSSLLVRDRLTPVQQRPVAQIAQRGGRKAPPKISCSSLGTRTKESYEAFARANRLPFSPEATLRQLETLEKKATLRENLGVASQAHNAFYRIQEIQRNVEEWQTEERAAVADEKYTAAISCVRRAKALIEEYDELSSQDWESLTKQMGDVDTMKKVTVRFALKSPSSSRTTYFVVGSGPDLGDWSAQNAKPLQFLQGAWRGSVDLRPGVAVEFKFLQRVGSRGELKWQTGPNRKLVVPSQSSFGLDVLSKWDGDWSTDLAWSIKPAATGR